VITSLRDLPLLADELMPGNELFHKLMQNASDTAEEIAYKVLTESKEYGSTP
jgi:hypothetical protein